MHESDFEQNSMVANNWNLIKSGMVPKDVGKLIGKPDKIEKNDKETRVVCHWGDSRTVIFENGSAKRKELRCQNCHEIIGDLQTVYSFQNKSVCLICHRRLQDENTSNQRIYSENCVPITSYKPTNKILRKPTMPAVILAGLWLYLGAFILGFVGGASFPELFQQINISTEWLFLMSIAQIIGLIYACKGYLWGAVLITALSIIGIPSSFEIAQLHPFFMFLFVLGIIQMFCFIMPSALTYYKECKNYRLSLS